MPRVVHRRLNGSRDFTEEVLAAIADADSENVARTALVELLGVIEFGAEAIWRRQSVSSVPTTPTTNVEP